MVDVSKLALMHADIAHAWSVEELAREAGLSRSGLGERFTRVSGVAPMHYLADWHLQVAGQKLRDSSDPLARVAEQVGYESEAAFSRAFKKKFGATPATWRRTGQVVDPRARPATTERAATHFLQNALAAQ